MAAAGTLRLKTENYEEQKNSHWPSIGKHILAQYDEDWIVVYQAFCPEIADYAVQNGKFGGPRYSFTRMTWIKTNFLWMMYRSKWAQKKNQDRILAIFISREGFDQILKFSKGTGIRVEGRTPGNVRIQWDPDHDPKGENQRRRAVQIGIKGIPLQRFHEQYIQHIEDITDFVKQQRQHVLKSELHKLITPVERVYRPSEEGISRHILLDEFQGSKTSPGKEKLVRGETVSVNKPNKEVRNVPVKDDGACCEEILSTIKTKPAYKGNKVDLIVCLGGSFNPVHTGHIELVETAIKWLEKNSNYHVVAARLAVAPDNYVEKKCKRKGEVCLKAEHRIRLCELACKGHQLIKTHYTTTSSARNCAENVKKWENLKNAKVAVLIGADKAMFANGHWRWRASSKYLTVCVGRKGKTDMVRKAYFDDCKEDLTSNPDFCMIEDELEDINSTEIRQQLFKEENDLKSASNNQKNIGSSDKANHLKEIIPVKETIEKTLKEADVTVPSSWEEITDEELLSLETEDTTCKSDTNQKKEQAEIENDKNVTLTWDEHETEQNVPSKWDGLTMDPERDNENNRLCWNLDLNSEKYGARMKTSNYMPVPEATETMVTLSKDSDPDINTLTRKEVVECLVSKGWLAQPVAEYILDNFSDLYV